MKGIYIALILIVSYLLPIHATAITPSCVHNSMAPYDYQPLVSAGYTPDEACAFIDAGGTQELAENYKAYGFTPKEAVVWVASGFKYVSDFPSVEDASKWKTFGYTANEASLLTKYYTVDTVKGLLDSGFTKDKVGEWKEFSKNSRNSFEPTDSGHIATEIIDWSGAGYTPADAIFYSSSGLDVGGAKVLKRYCHGKLEKESIMAVNPYKTKGRCYVFSGVIDQLINEITAIARVNVNQTALLLASEMGVDTSSAANGRVRVIFGKKDGAPSENSSFSALIKSQGAYKYVDGQGGTILVANVKVIYIIKNVEDQGE